MPLPTLSTHRPLRYGTFLLLYLLQGLPAGFSGTALVNYLIAQGVRPDHVGAFAAAAALPWGFQFAWGPIVDRFQDSPMGRRRPWVLLAQVLAFAASLGLLVVDDPAADIRLLGAAFFLHSVFASLQDAAVDAMAISTIPVEERGRLNGVMRAGFISGIGIGAISFALLLRHAGFTNAVLVHSAALLILTASTAWVRERPDDALWPGQRTGHVRVRLVTPPLPTIFARTFRGLLAPANAALFGCIVTGYLGANVFYRVFVFHLIRRVGWTDTDVSVMSGTLGTLVPLAVVLAGGVAADRFGQRRLLTAVLVLVGGFLVIFSLLGPVWPRSAVAVSGLLCWSTFDPLISVTAMPVLMAICRPGVEGSQFTAYMALVNLTDVAGQYLAGLLVLQVSAPAVGVLCGCAVLAAAALVPRRTIGDLDTRTVAAS